MGQNVFGFRPRTILNIGLFISAVVGTGFFIKNWNNPLTDATIFSAILVGIPIQVLIKRYAII